MPSRPTAPALTLARTALALVVAPGLLAAPLLASAQSRASYGPNLRESCRRLAVYVDKILKGARPADIPVELPTRVELVVNLRAAKALGVTVPPTVLLRADQVID
ncbi:MAG TPA: ABC transporter substrate binding protein [Methylomirabilota bacterium]|nr:ABC transporter substrate binding protein [Methylomirabilota bacterium]HEV8617147.1 ABC transporter substrate binding protein [Methylomirabilota bacterium]